MVHSKIYNVFDLLGVILKSSIMLLVGMCSSWIVSIAYDKSLIIIMLCWIMCEIVSNFIVRPIIYMTLPSHSVQEPKEVS